MESSISTLGNGLRVVTTPMDLRSMTVMIFVGAGSRYESAEVSGISHFLEHLFFKGTERRPSALAIASEVDALGAQFNAYTSKEYTGYWIRGAAEILPQALDMLSDMLRNALLPDAEIERERGVILEEIKLYEDTPQRRVFELFDEIWYGDQPLGRPIIGRPEVIQRLTRQDFSAYRERLYSPGRMLVAIAGGVRPEEGVALAEEYLGSLAPQPTHEPPAHLADLGERLGVVRKPILQSHVALGFPGFGTEDERMPALEIMCNILGGNMSSRLFTSVREREGLCYTVRASASEMSDNGHVLIYAGTDPDKARRALDLTVAECRRIAAEPVTEDELTRAKSFLRGMTVLAVEDSRSVVGHTARDLVLLGRIRSIEEELAKLEAVTIEQVQKVAAEVMVPEQMKLAVVGPFDDAGPFRGLLPGVA